jgi:hypothetical protein
MHRFPGGVGESEFPTKDAPVGRTKTLHRPIPLSSAGRIVPHRNTVVSMKTNSLLIAVAGVVVVAFVLGAGLLFIGGGQLPGPLSGSIVPSTTLSLEVSPCVPDAGGRTMSYNLTGKLLDSGGAPVAGRTVALDTASCRDGACATTPSQESATTGPAGDFRFEKHESPTGNYDGTSTYVAYWVSFAGDAEYGPSYSPQVKKLC